MSWRAIRSCERGTPKSLARAALRKTASSSDLVFALAAEVTLDGRPLANEELADDVAHARIGQVMGGVGERWLEPARSLVLAACARLERLEPARDRVFDAVIVADIEVKERQLDLRAPVPPIESFAAFDVEGSGDGLAILGGDHPCKISFEGGQNVLLVHCPVRSWGNLRA